MIIQLARAEIDGAVPKVEPGLTQYLWLQAQVLGRAQFYDDAEFRRRYNHFYRVRRSAAWQKRFFELMGYSTKEQVNFKAVLDLLRESTGRYESSFASKLIATLDPSKPVIDSVVLKRLGLRIPPASTAKRSAAICALYQQLEALFAEYLSTENGKYLVHAFDKRYPDAGVTNEKKLDLVLWQCRG